MKTKYSYKIHRIASSVCTTLMLIESVLTTRIDV